MKNPLALKLFPVLFLITTQVVAQTTYYSRNTGGNWDDVNSWTLNSSGTGAAASAVPGRADHVIILNGSTIQISATNDNGSPGVSPNDLSLGGYSGSGTKAFYQTGDITINNGGSLSASVRLMTEGDVIVSGGTLQTAASTNDYVVHGLLHVQTGSTFSVGDDFILSDDSETIIDVNGISADDIYLDRTNAFLCGSGALEVGDAIQEFNSADASNQICDTFTITCTDGDCGNDVGNVGSFTGSGSFTLPVEISAFYAAPSSRSVRLNWTTVLEENFDFFTLERAGTDLNFVAISTLQGNGFSTSPIDYQFEDRNPLPGVNYYRLKATDLDGFVEYHRIISVQFSSVASTQIYPNPVSDYSFSVEGNATQLRVVNLMGHVVMSELISAGTRKVTLPSQVKAGTYIALLMYSDGTQERHQLIIQ